VIDLHAHILPGVDDGATSIDVSIEMAKVAAERGTKVILATPHRKDVTESSSVQHITELVEHINGEMKSQNIDLSVVLGMENHLDLELPDEVTNGRALPMNGTRYILVEMPFFGCPNYAEDVLFRLQLNGLTPVLAHPERIEAFQRDPDLLVSLVERGMLSQVTAGSFVGYFGKEVRRFANTLLGHGLVHLIASDTHFPGGARSPNLRLGLDAVRAIVGPERAKAMVLDTPGAILGNLDVQVEPPTSPEKPRKWFQFWHR